MRFCVSAVCLLFATAFSISLPLSFARDGPHDWNVPSDANEAQTDIPAPAPTSDMSNLRPHEHWINGDALNCEYHDYIVVGAGPGGIQIAYYLSNGGHDHVILERGSRAGHFFETFPRHRKLISINKRFTGKSSREFSLRHDWNSLLTLADQDSIANPQHTADVLRDGLLFQQFDKTFYPHADSFVKYCEAFVSRHHLTVHYNTTVTAVLRHASTEELDARKSRWERQVQHARAQQLKRQLKRKEAEKRRLKALERQRQHQKQKQQRTQESQNTADDKKMVEIEIDAADSMHDTMSAQWGTHTEEAQHEEQQEDTDTDTEQDDMNEEDVMEQDAQHISDFIIQTNTNKCYRARYLILATGFAQIYHVDTEGAELVEPYSTIPTTPGSYENQSILILGKGNSAHETAQAVMDEATVLQLGSRSSQRLAFHTHYVGDLRAVNDDLLDLYQLKSLGGLLEFEIKRDVLKFERLPSGEIELVDIQDTSEDRHKERRFIYDRVISCLGFRADVSPFIANVTKAVQEAQVKRNKEHMNAWIRMTPNGKYPLINSAYQSVSAPHLYIAGTLAHSRDWRKSAGGFIHGLRYTARALYHIMQAKHHHVKWPAWNVPKELSAQNATTVDRLLDALLLRANDGSGIYQMFGNMGDVIIIKRVTDDDGDVTLEWEYITDVPVDFISSPTFRARMNETSDSIVGLFVMTLEFHPCFSGYHSDVFHPTRAVGDVDLAHQSNFLHPVIRYFHLPLHPLFEFNKSEAQATHHIIEDVLAQYELFNRHRVPLYTFFNNIWTKLIQREGKVVWLDWTETGIKMRCRRDCDIENIAARINTIPGLDLSLTDDLVKKDDAMNELNDDDLYFEAHGVAVRADGDEWSAVESFDEFVIREANNKKQQSQQQQQDELSEEEEQEIAERYHHIQHHHVNIDVDVDVEQSMYHVPTPMDDYQEAEVTPGYDDVHVHMHGEIAWEPAQDDTTYQPIEMQQEAAPSPDAGDHYYSPEGPYHHDEPVVASEPDPPKPNSWNTPGGATYEDDSDHVPPYDPSAHTVLSYDQQTEFEPPQVVDQAATFRDTIQFMMDPQGENPDIAAMFQPREEASED